VASSATLRVMTLPDYNRDAAMEAFEREDYQSVFQLAIPYASAGNSDAQVMVACLYQTGLGVERDVLEAERWLIKAATQNNALAWHNLGSLYAGRIPELKDRWGDVRKCYEKAKELGFNVAHPYPPAFLE